MDEVKLLVLINASTLVSILTFGIKFIRFMNRLEFKTDLMWEDYESRVNRRQVFKRELD